MRLIVTLIALLMLGFTGTALAQSAVTGATDGGSLLDLTRPIFDAIVHGQWWAAAAAGVVLACAAARQYMPKSWTEGVKGDIIGTATAFVMAFAGAIATWAAAPGAVMSMAVILTAFKIGVVAIGGYNLIHKVVGWLAAWGALPAWVTPMLKVIASMVGSKAVAKAKQAGDAAVKASPATGMAGDQKIVEVE